MLLGATGANPLPLLTAIVLLPVAGAVVCAALPKSRLDVIKLAGLLTAVITAALTIYLLVEFDTAASGYQFVSKHELTREFGVSWHLGVDGISLFLVVLTGLLFPIAMLGADPHKDHKPYICWLLVLEAGVLGAFLSLDLLWFFIFFEVGLIPMYFLIGGWGYDRRVYAAVKFFLYTMAGSAVMLVGILGTVVLYANQTGEGLTFDLVEIAENAEFSMTAGRWLFVAFAIAFAVKVPLFPLHTWLPDAHTQAPTAGSVILAGVLLKLGTYGFVRFCLYLFPEASDWAAPVVATLAVIGIIYGAVVATMQTDLKRLVAYSSVAHLGFIILGTFALTRQGITGGVVQMVNHGITTPALFLLVGMISERRHTREIASLKGLQQVAPVFSACFMIVMLASIGVPGLNGFVGEFMILIGSFPTLRWWTVIAATGVILAALYLLWAYQRTFHGPTDDENRSFKEMTWSEGAVMAPFVALIVFAGIYPVAMTDRITPSVERLVAHVEARSSFVEPAASGGLAIVIPEGEGEGDGGEESDGEGEGE
jgi:NADH-quinone oxidoreductase subunit M